ncbi:type 2 isopentenyl-diphosphate Delta-isomerase [Marinobacterium rhizophilum]|uniref:Isopentenyl-diphosphate delta-isomerase n=1 Tax=Marinobacterium rhizophilum TaxID=420402 RepID=A0ABY5HNC3_9GAMM|nr:type 2 isopentenyl-diphosphate Delta-isomerase [Marinobacterium rhizophilum]UTW13933.1 type 2 isopentenyl-diphosphate Delta-isomerase [Marinobacterium rhizophilum]
MSDPTNERKIQHIRAIEKDPAIERGGAGFDRIRLRHRALPNLDLAAIDSSTTLLGKTLSFPLLISSMTGGDHVLVRTINRNLAEAAERCQVALAVGSQRVMFTQPQARASFELRQLAPTTLLMGNIGAVQLNYGFDQQQCQEAVDCLQADALYLHLNPLQEAIQPEGDTNFAGLGERIAALASSVSVPLILKEVGCGLAPEDIAEGLSRGVTLFDVAGSGGTSWSRIEHHRSSGGADPTGLRFQDWGTPTPLALQLARPYADRATLIASGGLRDGIDMVKSVILGGALCGLAAPFLRPAMESADAVVAVIEQLRKEFRIAMFLLGTPDIASLFGNQNLILEQR